MSEMKKLRLEDVEGIDSCNGSWIAVVDNKIIVDGNDIAEVYEKAVTNSPNKKPTFHKISDHNKYY